MRKEMIIQREQRKEISLLDCEALYRSHTGRGEQKKGVKIDGRPEQQSLILCILAVRRFWKGEREYESQGRM